METPNSKVLIKTVKNYVDGSVATIYEYDPKYIDELFSLENIMNNSTEYQLTEKIYDNYIDELFKL